MKPKTPEEIEKDKKLISEKELAFIATVTKITALAELLGEYEPGNPDRFWDTCTGLSEILSGIASRMLCLQGVYPRNTGYCPVLCGIAKLISPFRNEADTVP